MFNIPRLKELLIEAYKKDPKPMAKFAKEVGISLTILHNFMLTEKATRMQNLAKIENYLQNIWTGEFK